MISKTTKKRDPYFDREAKKYQDPIASREFIIQRLKRSQGPVGYVPLIKALGIKRKTMRDALRRRLNAMVRDGQILVDRKGRYALVDQMNMVSGFVIAHKDGYGFLVPDDGGSDLFLSPKEMRVIFPGDRVLASVIPGKDKDRREGGVVEILERNLTSIVGAYCIEKGIGFIRSSNKNINQEVLVPKGEEGGAKNGQFVAAKILSYPTHRNTATAQITKILGSKLGPGLEIEMAINAHGLPHDWPEDVLNESKLFKNAKVKKQDKNRILLQHLPFVTIDGEDAKDFDDAVYCEPNDKGGWTLCVAIADVAHYINFNTPLDKEALNRGNSVYFPNNVVPMLPEVLSNDLCSLKPKQDRLAMVCEMKISDKGKITRYEFYEAVIKSHERLTYDQVFGLLESKNKKTHPLLPKLQELKRLYLALLKQRKLRGALDFSRVEAKIIFNDKNKIKEIKPVESHYVHGMIEECMLAANVSASKFLLQGKMPALYRVHEGPNADRLGNLRNFLSLLGLELKGGDKPKPSHYADLLQKIIGIKEEHLVQTVLLRSLRQAVYTAENVGHFGLAYEGYVHFTSPIRRYPDLINHRSIKHLLHGGKPSEYLHTKLEVQSFGNHCSMTERRADDASRDVVTWLKCDFMRDKVGKTFAGIISGVTSYGIFVELKDIFVEGLVHITSLKNDYYQFDSLRQNLVGRRSGKTYRLGDKLKVSVAKVDVAERQIDFELVK